MRAPLAFAGLPATFSPRLALLSTLVRRDLSVRYRGALLGAAWPAIAQIAQLAVFTYIFGYIFKARAPVTSLPETPAAFGIWLFAGLLAWNAFVPGVIGGAQSIVSQPNMVKKMLFPLVLLPLVPLISALIESVPGIVAVVILLALTGHLSTMIVALPFFVLLLAILTAGGALLAAATTVYFRDIPQALSPILLFAFYLTPIVYPLSLVPQRLRIIEALNPMAVITAGYRWSLMDAPSPALAAIGCATLECLAVFALGWAAFRKLRHGFADVL